MDDSLQPVAGITADFLVQEVVERHPEAISVFSSHGLQCPGCYISPFHTIADVAREYALVIEPLLRDLNRAITADPAQPIDTPRGTADSEGASPSRSFRRE